MRQANGAPAAGFRRISSWAIYYRRVGWGVGQARRQNFGPVAATGAILHRAGMGRFENRANQGQL
jgi:hypothetical protein